MFFLCQSIIGKTLNISTFTNIHTSMVIQTKQVFKYVLHGNIIIVFLHFDELGPGVYIKLKNMLPVLEFHEIWSTYFYHIWRVLMLKWYLYKDRNVFNFNSKFG